MAIITPIEDPASARTKRAISVKGIAICASTAPMITFSVQPRRSPAISPRVAPINMPMQAPKSASDRVNRKP